MTDAAVPTGEEPVAPAGERLRQQLGLDCDPFAEAALPSFYFVGGQRRYLVQQAVHQLYFGAPIVLLVGAWGAGKSRLLTEVRRELTGLADLCLTAATVMTDAAALRREIAAAAGLPTGAAHSNETLLASLERSRPQQAQPQPILLLLDDAHLLAPAELAASLELVQLAEGRIRALLAAEVSLFASWPPQLRAAEGLVARLDLEPLDPQESVDYLRTRLQAAGLRTPLPLDAAAERQLFKDSRGNLAAIHETGTRLLLTALTPATRQPGERRRLALPGRGALTGRGRWGALVAGVVLLAGALLWLGDDEPPPADDEARQVIAADGGRRRVPLVLDWEQPDAAVVAQSDAGDVAPMTTKDPAPPAPVPAPTPASAPPAAPESAASSPPAPAAASSSAPAVSAAPPAPAPAESEPPAAPTRSTALAEAPSAAPVPAKLPASSAATSANNAFSPDEQALLALPADQRVMVQLMGARALADLRRSIQASGFAGRVYYLETRLSGRPWFIALSGPHHRDEARAAIDAMPATLRAAKPWPRPLSGIQDEVRARRQ